MNKRKLKGNAKEAISSLEKRKIVEELRSGMLIIKQSTKKYQLSESNLHEWNCGFYKTRRLKCHCPKSAFLMVPSQTTVEQLKQQLAEAQAQLAQIKLQIITFAEKQLQVYIKKTMVLGGAALKYAIFLSRPGKTVRIVWEIKASVLS